LIISVGARLKHTISTEEQLANCYNTSAKQVAKEDPTGTPLVAVVVMPGSKPQCDAALKKIDSATLPSLLREAHAWQAQINDSRRVNLVGANNVITGLNIHSYKVPEDSSTRKSSFGRTALCPEYMQPVQAEVSEDEADRELAEEKFLEANTKEHLGWRVSYRSGRVEALEIKKVRPQLKRTFNVFQSYASGMAKRHSTRDKATMKARTDANNAKAKQRRARLRAMAKRRDEPQVGDD
jgi:hypothetical protein